MNIKFLRTFLTVVEEKSFSSAARRLGLTQPAVTKHIQALEKHFEALLFKRKGWRSELTEAGQVLLVYARRIVSTFDEAERQLKKIGEKVSGALKVGASTIPGEYVLPLLVGEFTRKYPEVRLQVEIADSGRVIRMVASEDLDVGVVGAKSEEAGLEFYPFAQDRLVLVVGHGHPWAKKEAVDPAELTKIPLIWREKDSGTRKTAEAILAQHGVNPEDLTVAMELGSTEAVVNATISGSGATIISKNAAQRHLILKSLVEVEIRGVELTRPLYLVYRKERALSPVVDAFVSYVKESTPIVS
ncbi:MAG: LysR family transcriptional regulator [Firmicutes bacterium]|nr:LysR family transcriptional regulator [Bacillota bacterium]